MSLRALTSVWESSTQEGGPLLVMLALADNANDQMIAYPSVPTIARKARLSERQVRRVLRDLEEAGEIKVVGTKSNNVKSYLLTPSLAKEKAEQPGQNDRAPEATKPGQIVRSEESKPGHGDRASPDNKPGHDVRADISVRASPDIAMSAKPSIEPLEVVGVNARDAMNLDRETLDRMEHDLSRVAGQAFPPTSFAIHDMTLPILWLQRGLDWHLDVLPTIALVTKAAVARDGPGRINNWKYFQRAIETAHRRRTSPAVEAHHDRTRQTAGDRNLQASIAGLMASGDHDEPVRSHPAEGSSPRKH